MECFDHGKEMVGLCGWCGKQVCPSCIGRQDGRKKYCRDCSAKMGDFSPPVRQTAPAAPEPALHNTHHEEQPRIVPIAQKKPAVALGHPKFIDPKHFSLDDDAEERPRHHEAPHATPHREEPKHSDFEPFKPFPIKKPITNVGSSAGSNRPAAPGANAASKAMGMFAASAAATKAGAPSHSIPSHAPVHSSPMSHSAPSAHPAPSHSTPLHSAAPHAAPVGGSAHVQSGRPIDKNAGSSAAAKAFGFLAASAQETKNK